MINAIIGWSVHNRLYVILMALLIFGWGIYAVKNTPMDALPDLSDVQVIIKTSYPGQAPQVVEDQITYPLTSAMLSVPKAQVVRGFSFFGDSYVYVIFEDGTDIYWARSRVMEYLNQVAGALPDGIKPQLGPDASGVGWVYQYALIDRTGRHDLAELRTLQDWFLKYELQTVAGVSEVATVGGMVKQYQVEVDPNKLRAYDIPLSHVRTAIQRGNSESGASVIEMAEAEYMVRASGYIQSGDDLKNIPLSLNENGTPLLLGDIANIVEGPQMRRGIGELNGEGEAVSGIIVMRYGENAQTVIEAVKEKLASLKQGLPAGVEIVEVYDRSNLIKNAVDNLYEKLTAEFIVVVLICALFLYHLRSSLVIVISLPIGILGAFIVMHAQGINANIMSLGGIAIAIGTMVDGAIVMVENVHKHIEREPLTDENRWRVITQAAQEVGSPLFFSLLIITVSFLPVFTLQAQEGRLFSPLVYTKTYAMAVSAGLAITLVPVLLGYFVRGNIVPEAKNPLNRWAIVLYMPAINFVLRFPRTVILLALVSVASAWLPYSKMGSEFMPSLDEGDLMYMPTTYAGISIGEARQLLQQTDRLIKTLPEVKTVYGKMGRADTATDPAPLTMIETVIQFHPREQWRAGMTAEKIRAELDELVTFPGLTNAWVMPIKTRIDMLATGIKTPLGIKISGPDLKQIEQIGRQLETVLAKVEGTSSVYSERVVGGRYINVDINRKRAARYGLNVADLQEVVRTAIGGVNVTTTIEGRARFPVNLRYPQRYRDSSERLKLLPIVTPSGARVALADVADIYVADGPPMLKSENARINGWALVDIKDRDLGTYIADAKQVVSRDVALPVGYSLAWAGQYEYMLRAQQTLQMVVPVTLVLIALLLFLSFQRVADVALILGTLPFALVGGIWFMFWAGFHFSVAAIVGFIALAGLAAELGVLMQLYLNIAWQKHQQEATKRGDTVTLQTLKSAIIEGACLRVRPKLMTVMSVLVGLVPVMISSGVGSEVMQRIAGPMVGGLLSALVLVLLVIPAVYFVWQSRGLNE